MTRTGGVDLFPADPAIAPEPYRTSLDDVGVSYEWLDGGEIRRRWPAFARGTLIDGDVSAIFSAETGIVPAGSTTATLHRLAVEHGARLHDRTSVVSVEPSGDEVTVVTERGVVRCASVVICADAWTNRLVEPLGHRIAMAVTREQVSYFPTSDLDDLRIGRFPVWIWMDDPSFYGFPTFGPPDVADTAKGSEDCGGPEVDPDTRTFEPDEAMEQRLGRFMAALLGDRFATPRTTTCLYTLTADRDFVIDRLPDHPNVYVGLGAAHGFKFAAWFGRTLAALACGESAGPELAPFAIDRASLRGELDRSAWLV